MVLSRGAIHAGGPYRCPNVRIRARATRTNTPPNGAFRGFGAPQVEFAAEIQLGRLAETLGLSPLEIRRRNLYRIGDETPTPPRSAVQATLSARPQRSGSPFSSDTPVPSGPRHWGQSAADTAAIPVTARHKPIAIARMVRPFRGPQYARSYNSNAPATSKGRGLNEPVH